MEVVLTNCPKLSTLNIDELLFLFYKRQPPPTHSTEPKRIRALKTSSTFQQRHIPKKGERSFRLPTMLFFGSFFYSTSSPATISKFLPLCRKCPFIENRTLFRKASSKTNINIFNRALVIVLLTNAIAILSEDRFLARSSSILPPPFHECPRSSKTQEKLQISIQMLCAQNHAPHNEKAKRCSN
jgi:hypothetical protein